MSAARTGQHRQRPQRGVALVHRRPACRLEAGLDRRYLALAVLWEGCVLGALARAAAYSPPTGRPARPRGRIGDVLGAQQPGQLSGGARTRARAGASAGCGGRRRALLVALQERRIRGVQRRRVVGDGVALCGPAEAAAAAAAGNGGVAAHTPRPAGGSGAHPAAAVAEMAIPCAPEPHPSAPMFQAVMGMPRSSSNSMSFLRSCKNEEWEQGMGMAQEQ